MSTRERLEHARTRLRRLIRRRRRPLAAACAALAVLFGLASLRPPAADVVTSQTQPASGLLGDEVAVPVALGTAAMARALTPGGVIDLVSVEGSAPPIAHVVARGVRVLALPDSGSAFSPTTTAVITVAVPEHAALDLVAANATGPLSVLVRPTARAARS